MHAKPRNDDLAYLGTHAKYALAGMPSPDVLEFLADYAAQCLFQRFLGTPDVLS
jgi:hypothetical protein